MNQRNYFSDNQLFGDDFSIEQIIQWYKEEEEAYANLYGNCMTASSFSYHNIDKLFGFKFLKNKPIEHAMGLGASWGYEFLPIIDQIKNLTIVESSEQTVSKELMGGGTKIVPNYLKSQISGKIMAADNSFDLITAFSVLHHIPNVSFVISELIRTLKPGGILLLREPIHSMGLKPDHSTTKSKRNGLTLNERGIPHQYLQQIFEKHNCKIISCTYHFFMYSFLNRLLSNAKFLRSKCYLRLDKFLSHLFLWNVHYDPQNKFQRIAPQYVYYVVEKV